MYVNKRRGLGQGIVAETGPIDLSTLPLTTQRTIQDVLRLSPGFTPVPGQPGAFTIAAVPTTFASWFARNSTVVYAAAGTLLLLALMGGRRRR